MNYLFPDQRIIIFCKAPVPGQVKTRLMPVLGAEGAADLHRKLAQNLIRQMVQARLAPVALWCSPTPDHEFFQSFDVPLYRQTGDDLGQRMHEAMQTVLADDAIQGAVLTGTDCINLDPEYLTTALQLLSSSEAVLGPAEDGGYGLIGLKKANRHIFTGIDWSTDRVLAQTASALNREVQDWRLLDWLWDLDRPADLVRYQRLNQPQINQTLSP